MEGESTVDKLQGMSLRDQDERNDEESSRLTPESEAQDVVALPFQPDAGQDDTDDRGTVSQATARSGLRPPALPTPESAAIAAKRAQLQAALRDRPRWMARPDPEPAPVVAPVDMKPEIEPEADEETPVDLTGMALSDDTSDTAILPYSPPDWKAVFGTIEDAAETGSDSGHEIDEAETIEPDDAAVLPEPDDLPYANDEPVAEEAAEPAYVDLTFDMDEPEVVMAESAEAEIAIDDDDEPQHVFAEPPALLESPAAQEARRRFRAAYDLYRAPQPLAASDAAEEPATDRHESAAGYSSSHEQRDYFGGYEEAAPLAAMAEDPHYARQPVSHEISPPSEPLRRAANVAQSRYGAPIRAPMRRPQPFEGASSNMREALDSLNSRGRVARRDTVRRTVAKQRRASRTMSGVAVAAALLMSACGGLGIYAWQAGGLDAVLGLLQSASPETPVRQAAMAPEAGFEDTATTKPQAADAGSDQQPGEQNDGPVVVEATPTSTEGSNAEGPTGALPEASKEETPAEHMPAPVAEAPPLPEAPAAAAVTPPAPAASEPSKEPVKTQSTVGKPTKKRFHTARLSVADVEGVEQQSIPLNLTMDAGDGAGDVQLRLSGLPEAASLSAGQKLADGAWVVTARDAPDLKVLTPDIQKPERHTVAVEAVETKTGSLAAPTQEMQLSIVPRNVIVEPAAASTDDKPAPSQGGQSQAVIEMPPAKPAAVPPPDEPPVAAEPAPEPEKPAAVEKPAKLPKLASLNAEPDMAMTKPAPAPAAEPSGGDDDLIARGDELLSLGDIVAARQLYEFAFDRGQMQAAVALGRTYDPVTFEKLKVRGLTPNPQTALAWYKKAEKAGVKGAQADIEALTAWLAR
jgi:hypothetical protein